MHSVHEISLNSDEDLRCFSTSDLEYLPYCKDSGGLFFDNCLYDLRGSRLDYGYFTHDSKPCSKCKTHVVYKMKSDEFADSEIMISLIDVSRDDFPISVEISDGKYIYKKDEEFFGKDDLTMPDMWYNNIDETNKGKYKNRHLMRR